MTIDSLFEQLKHPNPNMRERAMWEIAEVRDENTIPRLIGLLGEEDVSYRRTAVKTLGCIGSDSIAPLIELFQKSDNTTILASCIKAMAQVSFNHPEDTFPDQGLQMLKTALDDSNPVVHTTAVMALGQIGIPALDILLEALKTTENVAVAVAIINALGSLVDDRVTEILTKLSEDESADSYVRESAISALSRLEMVSGYQKANN